MTSGHVQKERMWEIMNIQNKYIYSTKPFFEAWQHKLQLAFLSHCEQGMAPCCCPAEGRHKGWCAGGTWGSGCSPHIFLCSSEEWQHEENKKEKPPRERISKDLGILWRQKIFFNKYLYRIPPLCESEITVHFIPLVLVCSWRPFS